MKDHGVWALALILSVAAVSYWSTQYYIEEAKQEAFMMKACVDAGGEWSKSWNRIPSCLRKDARL